MIYTSIYLNISFAMCVFLAQKVILTSITSYFFTDSMKAILLSAWEGTRLRPLTETIPKAMVEVYNKPLLAHNMDRVLAYVDEFIIVIRYMGDSIKEYFWNEYKWVPISYHQQGEDKGTGAALRWISSDEDIVIIYSDTLISQKDIDRAMNSSEDTVFVKSVEHPEKYWIFETDKHGYAQRVVEKPQIPMWNLANMWFFKVNSSLLDYIDDISPSPRWEYELTDAVNNFLENNRLRLIELQYPIIDITTIEDLEAVNAISIPKLWETRYLENIWEFEVYLGIPDTAIPVIVWYSNNQEDTALQNNTSDQKRFWTQVNLRSWYDDPWRHTFSILDPEGNISWIAFYRPSQAPEILEVSDTQEMGKLDDASHISTGWIRLYPNARGKRLASPLLDVSERVYRLAYPNTVISVDIEEDNIPSQKAFERAGYKHVWYWENKKTVWNDTHRRKIYTKSI